MPIPTIHCENPAFSLIERLGGKSAVADRLNVDKSTLSRWCQPKPAGTGGVIPQKHWAHLIAMGKEQGVDITLEELAALEP